MLSCLNTFRSLVACALVTSMTLGPLAAAGEGNRPSSVTAGRVDGAALMLDRFTFGARPGDLQRVRAMGVNAWFEEQLAPERLDDSALEQRLDAFPALRMTQADQIARYPTPALVRQAARSGFLPADPETRAILQDQVEFYQMRREGRAEKKAALAAPGATVASGTQTAPAVKSEGASTSTAPAMDMQQAALPMNLEQATGPMPQDQVDALLHLAPAQRYQRLLQMSPSELIAARKGAKGDGSRLAEGMSPLQKETLTALAGTNRMLSNELFSARLLRDVYSQRQLVAVMTDFWLNHFNVYIRKDGYMPSLLPEYEETVRAHALGRFEDLLEATAKSPAMLLYLDNAQSVGPDSPAAARPRGPNAKKPGAGLNENYARELMELHTLGVNGGYSQKDVTEVAKVFTGWGVERPGEGGEFLFNPRRHEPGSKQVLGKSIHEAGESEGEEVLHMLAASPATAHFISLELAQRFVSDTPPPALVERMEKTFLKTGGDIREVLRTLSHSPELFAPATVHAKIKTPLEYVVSSVRATDAEVVNALPLAQSLERLGMPLYGCQPPTGYKWDAETWLNSAALVNRMNFALLLSANRIGGTTVDTTALLNGAAPLAEKTAAEDASGRKEQVLESVVLPAGVSAQTRNAVLSQTDDSAVQQAMRDFKDVGMNQSKSATGASPTVQSGRRGFGSGPNRPNADVTDKQAAVMLGLLLGSPEFQRR